MLEKIINSISKGLKLIVGGALLVGVSSFVSPKSEASVVQEPIQTSTQTTQPVTTKLDYREGSIDGVATTSLAIAQSFTALDEWITDGSLKLELHQTNYHNMYLKIWPDNNGVPDIANELGTTTSELTPRGDTLVDYYLREFGSSPIQVIPGERYWLGLYNPDLNWYGFGAHSLIYGMQNPYHDGAYGLKWRSNYSWEIYDLESRDLAFSITFSNVDEPKLLELLLAGFSLGGLALRRRNK